ncbi:hypothetical protein B0H14DRAFT_2990592 [Mycena olivaceomarginata]|nr:hypothetical protein B0H14DRAFT_2990592 [Mycena olivaceomarginata]
MCSPCILAHSARVLLLMGWRACACNELHVELGLSSVRVVSACVLLVHVVALPSFVSLSHFTDFPCTLAQHSGSTGAMTLEPCRPAVRRAPVVPAFRVARPVLFFASVLDLRLRGRTRLGVVFARRSMPKLACDHAVIGASCKSAALLLRHYSARLWVVSAQHSVPELAPNWGTVESLVHVNLAVSLESSTVPES